MEEEEVICFGVKEEREKREQKRGDLGKATIIQRLFNSLFLSSSAKQVWEGFNQRASLCVLHQASCSPLYCWFNKPHSTQNPRENTVIHSYTHTWVPVPAWVLYVFDSVLMCLEWVCWLRVGSRHPCLRVSMRERAWEKKMSETER